MSESDIARQLSAIASEVQMAEEVEKLIDEWTAQGVGPEVIEPTLRFLESHPDWDFGLPGPLVHFVERFYKKGYEEKLVESVSRQPTPHTLWMLNRLINGERLLEKRRAYVELLTNVSRTASDPVVHQEAKRFLSLHSS
jgi:hypothetical protein